MQVFFFTEEKNARGVYPSKMTSCFWPIISIRNRGYPSKKAHAHGTQRRGLGIPKAQCQPKGPLTRIPGTPLV